MKTKVFNKVVFVGVFCFICKGVFSAEEKKLCFAEEGKANAVIVIDEAASDDVRFAAHDLRAHLEKATLAKFEIKNSKENVQETSRIEIGTSYAKMKALAAAKTLASGESAAVCDKDALYIWGEGQMGTANGVYVFLEKRLGCRWFTPWDEPVIPKYPKLSLGEFVDINRPKLTERWVLTIENTAQLPRNGILFHYRNRLNALMWASYQNVDLPKGVKALRPEVFCPNPMVHSIFLRMPPHDRNGVKGSFKEHPEWYSMDENGKRVDNMEVCYSNRGLREELTKRMIDSIDKFNGKGYFDLSQRDEFGGTFCFCPQCKALEKKYGTVGAPLFDCLKDLGNRLLVERPNAYVHFLAYRRSQTQKPPNEAFGKFPDNIIPVFAPIDGDFSKDYLHVNNARDYADLKRWCDITAKTWTWYYPMPYGGNNPPFLAIKRWAKDLKLAADIGLTGGSFEHDVGYKTGASFADLQAWLIAKLYEHPDLPVGSLIREFCRLYYGAAAKDIQAYIAELEKISIEQKNHLAWNGIINHVLDAEHLMRWSEIFDSAEAKVADKPVVLQRVREARSNVDYYVLNRYSKLKKAGFAVPPDAIYERLTNTYALAFERRSPGKENNPFGKALKYNPTINAYKKACRLAKDACQMAVHGAAPLPEKFRHLKEEDFIEIPNTGGSGGAKLVEVKDAAYGIASSDEKDSNDPKGFYCGYWDSTNKKFWATRYIKDEEVEETDKFCFYKLGVIVPAPHGYVFPGHSCRVRSQLDDCYTPGEPVYWELWLSLKFEGPRFKGSKAKENRVWYDRALLIKTKKPQ